MFLVKDLSKNQWDEFVKDNGIDGGFLQSKSWGDFQSSFGRQVFYLAVVDNDNKILATTLLIKYSLFKFFNYLYSPRGPVLSKNLDNDQKKQVFDFIVKETEKIAKSQNSLFIRFDPAGDYKTELLENKFTFFGSVQPNSTLMLDLSLSSEDLLKKMKSKTRYNIKVAKKHQVEIIVDEDKKYFADFYRLLIQTAKRDRIKIHSEKYYRKMLEISDCKLTLAKYQDKIIAVNLMVFFGKVAIYLHGASDYEFRNKMAPYLLQWEMIEKSKKDQFIFYDFWGANEKKWPGVTRFKTGFAPENDFILYSGAYDYPLNKFFYFFYVIIRKIIR